jgi:hypothetical protein
MGRSWFGGPFDVSVILLLVDPDSIRDGPWAQEGGPKDTGITESLWSHYRGGSRGFKWLESMEGKLCQTTSK